VPNIVIKDEVLTKLLQKLNGAVFFATQCRTSVIQNDVTRLYILCADCFLLLGP